MAGKPRRFKSDHASPKPLPKGALDWCPQIQGPDYSSPGPCAGLGTPPTPAAPPGTHLPHGLQLLLLVFIGSLQLLHLPLQLLLLRQQLPPEFFPPLAGFFVRWRTAQLQQMEGRMNGCAWQRRKMGNTLYSSNAYHANDTERGKPECEVPVWAQTLQVSSHGTLGKHVSSSPKSELCPLKSFPTPKFLSWTSALIKMLNLYYMHFENL